jgi:DNA-binding MarR family transcriptional regulator
MLADLSSTPAAGVPADREALLTALDRELRQMVAGTVLFQHAVAERLGINVTDLHCANLLDLGPLTAGQLAELTGLSTGAITGVVDRLERAGYVRRERDPDDRRRVIVRPLPEQARAAAPLFASMGKAMAELTARYSDGELAVILDFTARTTPVIRAEIAKLRPQAATAPSR